MPEEQMDSLAIISTEKFIKLLWHIVLCSARLGSSLCIPSINMRVSLGLSLLLAFLDPGTSLQCEVCHSIGKSCSGPMKTCSDGEDTCGIILHEVTIGGMAIPSSIKSCLPSSICQLGPVTMNYGKVKGRSHLACCMDDDCRTTSVSLPPESNVPNGYQCPACYSVDSFQCSNEIVNCTGSETQCVDLAGLMNSGGLTLKAAMKGCTTISECSIVGDGKNKLGMMDIKLRRFQCKPASVLTRASSGFAPLDTLFLPVVSGFILEKERTAGLGPSDQSTSKNSFSKDNCSTPSGETIVSQKNRDGGTSRIVRNHFCCAASFNSSGFTGFLQTAIGQENQSSQGTSSRS